MPLFASKPSKVTPSHGDTQELHALQRNVGLGRWRVQHIRLQHIRASCGVGYARWGGSIVPVEHARRARVGGHGYAEGGLVCGRSREARQVHSLGGSQGHGVSDS